MTSVSNAFLSEQEVMIRESARRVASEVVASTAAERDRSSAWPYDEIRAVAEVGFMGMLAPQAYGGAGLSFVEYCLAIEEFAAADGDRGAHGGRRRTAGPGARWRARG